MDRVPPLGDQRSGEAVDSFRNGLRRRGSTPTFVGDEPTRPMLAMERLPRDDGFRPIDEPVTEPLLNPLANDGDLLMLACFVILDI